MARNTVVDTPSPWHLMLAIFDEHPAGAIGTRSCSFTLKNGLRIVAKIRGVIRPSFGEGGLWQVIGEATNLPHGYYYFRKGVLVIYIDPFARTGYVDLELTSPCHGTMINYGLSGTGDRTGRCTQCNALVMRTSDIGDWEWVDPEVLRQAVQWHNSKTVRFMTDDGKELPEMSDEPEPTP